jgi:hypothetical protein
MNWKPILTVFGWTLERAWDKDGGYFSDSCAYYWAPGEWRYRITQKTKPGTFTPAKRI